MIGWNKVSRRSEDVNDEDWKPNGVPSSSEDTEDSENGDVSSDENWEPMEGKKMVVKKVQKAKRNFVRSSGLNVVTPHAEGSRLPRRTVPPRPNNKDDSFQDNDEILFCFECGCDHDGECPAHGPLIVVDDTPVATDVHDAFRAQKSAPSIVAVNVSAIPEVGNGVWAKEDIPARVRFGPCIGEIVPVDVFNPHAWVIRKNGQPDHCLDATDPRLSNWMRYVNRAERPSEQNMAAFQLRGEIYFQTIRSIKQQEELLVWYGDDYGGEATANPGSDEAKFECPACPYAFSTALFLERHEKYCRHHSMDESLGLVDKNIEGESETSEVDEPISKSVGATTTPAAEGNEQIDPIELSESISDVADGAEAYYKCEICSVWFFSEGLFKSHRKTHTGKDLDDDDFFYYCPKCERHFEKKHHLLSHMRLKHSKTPFKCKQCDKSFTRKNDLLMHVRTHENKNFLSCGYCDKKFILEEKLKKHEAVHEKHGELVCSKCGVKFASKATLERHVEKYCYEKCFRCGDCNKTFSQKRHLTSHLRVHTGEQPYQCSECGKRFSQRENYMRHLRSHNGDKPFACEQCGKSFAVKGNLQNHIWTHSKVKPHVCHVCNRGFAEKNTLTRHLRIHSGEKPFVCSFCDKRFNRRHHLKLHLEVHLKKDEHEFVDCGDDIDIT